MIGASLDLGELIALVTLEHLCQEASNIWGKKVSCQIICDGEVYQNVVGADATAYSFFHKNMQDLIQKHFNDHLIFEDQSMKTFKGSIEYKGLVGSILKNYANDFDSSAQRESIFKKKKEVYGDFFVFLSKEYLGTSKTPWVSFLPVCRAFYDCEEVFYNLTHCPNLYAPEFVSALTSCGVVEIQKIPKKDTSESSYQDWEILQAAELMQSLSQAYSKFLKDSFPSSPGQQVIDLSVHPRSKGKFYLPLVFGSMGTPWHNALYVDRENSCYLRPSCEITGGRKKSSELKVGETKLNLSYYQA